MEVRAGLADVMACEWIAERAAAVYRRRLLADTDLIARLEQMEDLRSLREDATRVIAQSQKLRDSKASRGSGSAEPEDPEAAAARKAKQEQVKTLREKLLKFVQAVPVFMYLTDYWEEALVDVIESLDIQAVRARHRPDSGRLPQARRGRRLQPGAHERGHLAVTALRARQPLLPRHHPARPPAAAPGRPVGPHRGRTR